MSKNTENLKNLMADQEFVNKIAHLEEPEDVQAAFAEKGVDISLEEINAIATMVTSDGNEELSETDMAAVTGGSLEIIGIIADGIKLISGVITEINNSRKAKGKSTIW